MLSQCLPFPYRMVEIVYFPKKMYLMDFFLKEYQFNFQKMILIFLIAHNADAHT